MRVAQIYFLVLSSSFLLLSFQDGHLFTWKVLCSGKDSPCLQRKTEVYHSQKEYQRAWKMLNRGDASSFSSPPPVNFKNKLVVACFAGPETNGMEADSVWIADHCLHLRMTRISLGSKCHETKLRASPFVWIEADRNGWNVLKEEEKQKTVECN